MFVGPAPHPAGETAAVAGEAFKETMAELASGVALLTTARQGARAGCAVSSFVSLSLAPPSLLVCLNAASSTLRMIEACGVFALNILAGDQEALARRFSDPKLTARRFEEGDWGVRETGAPVLNDALAVIECRLERLVPHATHVIAIGAVLGVARGRRTTALVHRRSRFEVLA